MRPEFHLHVNLPALPVENTHALYRQLTSDFEELRSGCRAAFITALQRLLDAGTIKRYTDVTSRQVWDYSSEFPEDAEPHHNFDLVALSRDGNLEVDFLGFEVGLLHSGPLAAPTQLGAHRDPPPFLTVTPPWCVELYRASVRALRKQDNFVFKLSLRLSFPLISKNQLPSPENCRHEFKALDAGAWEWRVLWRCTECDLVCHCKCFEKAIRSDPRKEWSGRFEIPRNGVPFIPLACDVCRERPSSHRFCPPHYAASMFERKYGAYVKKRIAELKADGVQEPDERQLENELRKQLGFPPFGRTGYSESELFRAVKAIFPDDEIQRRVRPRWLEGLEIDIYLPARRLAIEYQGDQHSSPVWHWGGENAVLKTRQHDARKKELLAANSITLCEFEPNHDLEIEAVRARINRALRQRARKNV